MDKQVVRTDKAPAPFQGAPYNQAIVHGGLVFVAGQLGIEPKTNQVVEGGIGPQTERVLENVRAILEEAGSGLDKVLKTTIYLVDLGDFQGMNDVYSRMMSDPYPARATVEIAALPSGALVELEAIAHL
jgi:2-iminobutanoate/2-iminopropanoate deaminase